MGHGQATAQLCRGLTVTDPGLPLPGMWPWLALYFVIGLLGTWLARGYALRNDLIDRPGTRRSHDAPTPRGGGIAIVAGLLAALVWLALTAPAASRLYAAIACGLLLVAGAGWIDDHRPLSPWVRLGTHAAAAVVLAWGIDQVGGNPFTAACALLLALVLVNIWNFMDGIDGLAASQAALVAAGYAWLAGGGAATWLAMALTAACLGFLPFNLPKARIFLGDVGSGALGYALAALIGLLLVNAPSQWPAMPVLLLPLSAFVVDATLTLAARMVRRERWWLPHTQHAYQRWVHRTGRHGVASGAYAAWTLAAVVLMLWVGDRAPAVIMAALGVTYLAAAAVWWRLQGMAGMTGPGVQQ